MTDVSIKIRNLAHDQEEKTTTFQLSGKWKDRNCNLFGLFYFDGGDDREANKAELKALLNSISDSL